MGLFLLQCVPFGQLCVNWHRRETQSSVIMNQEQAKVEKGARDMKGAGGSEGGLMLFFIGLAMLIAGGFLFFNSIQVTTHMFGLGHGIHSFGSFRVTTGMVLIPFIFGVGMIFYNAKNVVGWVLAIASLIMLSVGVLASVQFRLQGMSAFELITILVLIMGGLGFFLSSLRNLSKE